jgi:serine/threonine-protein kinase RsbW
VSARAAGPRRFSSTCPAELASLPALLSPVRQAAAAGGLDADTEGDLLLALEEACANVIAHGYPPGRPGPIEVEVLLRAGRVEMTVSDLARAFDPAQAPAPDLTSPWERRRIGGLGLHLIRELMDEVGHESPPGGGNRLTMIKHTFNPPGASHGHRDQGDR